MNGKVEKYLQILYPEYDALTPEQQEEYNKTKKFIEEHIEELDKYYNDCKQARSVAQLNGDSDQQIIKNGIYVVKIFMYFDILYPQERGNLPLERFELRKMREDFAFLYMHLHELEGLFTDFQNSIFGEEGIKNETKNEIQRALKIVIEGMKNKERRVGDTAVTDNPLITEQGGDDNEK